jgi:hypothetical protein
MLICPKCGTFTAASLKRCLRDQKDQCQFESLSRQRKSHPVFGFVCLSFGILAALGISTVLFVNPGREEGFMAIVQALVLIGVYTFVYTIAGVFFVVGLLLLFYRQQDLRDKSGNRFVQIASLLGKTLSFQVVDFEPPAVVTRYPTPPTIPASVAALHHVISEARLHTSSGSIVERLTHLNDVSDRLTQECLKSTMVSLMVRGAIKVRPAHASVVWPFLSKSAAFTTHTYLLEAVPEQTASGALESLLWERTRDWLKREQGDYPLATVRELVKTFEDSDGDFSSYQILRAVEEEAVKNSWFNRRPRFSFKRSLPEPNVQEGATIQEAVDAWMRILEAFRHHDPSLLRHIEGGDCDRCQAKQRRWERSRDRAKALAQDHASEIDRFCRIHGHRRLLVFENRPSGLVSGARVRRVAAELRRRAMS